MEEIKTELYFKENYQSLTWPINEDANYLKEYFEPLILNGAKSYISNIKSTPFIISVNGKVLPGILATNIGDCYVSSPYSHYITYAEQELREINSKFVRLCLKICLGFLGVFLKTFSIERVVYVNNWLLSTNLYISLTKEELSSINRALKERYPNRVIIYRSINEKTNSELVSILDQLGANKTLSRQVYITDPGTKSYLNHKDFHKDQKFLKKSKLINKRDNFNKNDLESIRKLYNQLYIDKYFDLNPQFTAKYFENAYENNLFEFQYLMDGDKPKAVLGYFTRNGAMTTPIFGFDTDAPMKEGLYRLISSLLMQESEQNNNVLNQSSGASNFKSQRGAVPFIEYNYYFSSHVPFAQKTMWKILSLFINTIGEFTLKKFKL